MDDADGGLPLTSCEFEDTGLGVDGAAGRFDEQEEIDFSQGEDLIELVLLPDQERKDLLSVAIVLLATNIQGLAGLGQIVDQGYIRLFRVGASHLAPHRPPSLRPRGPPHARTLRRRRAPQRRRRARTSHDRASTRLTDRGAVSEC